MYRLIYRQQDERKEITLGSEQDYVEWIQTHKGKVYLEKVEYHAN